MDGDQFVTQVLVTQQKHGSPLCLKYKSLNLIE